MKTTETHTETLIHAHLTEQNCHQVQVSQRREIYIARRVKREKRVGWQKHRLNCRKMSTAAREGKQRREAITGGGEEDDDTRLMSVRLHSRMPAFWSTGEGDELK